MYINTTLPLSGSCPTRSCSPAATLEIPPAMIRCAPAIPSTRTRLLQLPDNPHDLAAVLQALRLDTGPALLLQLHKPKIQFVPVYSQDKGLADGWTVQGNYTYQRLMTFGTAPTTPITTFSMVPRTGPAARAKQHHSAQSDNDRPELRYTLRARPEVRFQGIRRRTPRWAAGPSAPS